MSIDKQQMRDFFVNGIEYMIYWLLEYFEFIDIWHKFIYEIVTCLTSGYFCVEVVSVL